MKLRVTKCTSSGSATATGNFDGRHDGTAVGVDEIQLQLALALVAGHEGDAQRDGALRMHGGQLRRVDRVERAEQVQLAVVLGRRVAKNGHLNVHAEIKTRISRIGTNLLTRRCKGSKAPVSQRTFVTWRSCGEIKPSSALPERSLIPPPPCRRNRALWRFVPASPFAIAAPSRIFSATPPCAARRCREIRPARSRKFS